MKILCTGHLPALGRKMLEKEGHRIDEHPSKTFITTEQLMELCKSYDALISTTLTPLNKAFFEGSKHLKAIVILHAQYEHVDFKWATRNNIPVGHTPRVTNHAVAETALMLMIASSRQLVAQHHRITTNRWLHQKPADLLGRSLWGKTLGIYGLGQVGQEVARLCSRTFDMPVIYYNRSPNKRAEHLLGVQYVPLETLLEKSDVLSVHATLNLDSKGVFNERAFFAMKNSSIFINTANGKIHDQQALTRAVYEGWIWGAGLDTTDPCPIEGNHPLLGHPNVCITPGIALDTEEARMLMSKVAAKDLIAALKKERMRFCINPAVYHYIDHQ